VDRRAFLSTLTGSLLVAPLTAEAQQGARVVRIGYLDGSSPSARTTLLAAFKDGLRNLGYAPNHYVIDSRYAEGYDDRLPELAADLVGDKPDVILAVGPPPALAAARATSTIPIVFVVGDPVGTGLVPNLSRPPGNVTGITLLAVELAAKRLEILKEAVPRGGPGRNHLESGQSCERAGVQGGASRCRRTHRYAAPRRAPEPGRA
jgi:putative ABC transport system substrate-binding protein